jgi:hypothetical protein
MLLAKRQILVKLGNVYFRDRMPTNADDWPRSVFVRVVYIPKLNSSE